MIAVSPPPCGAAITNVLYLLCIGIRMFSDSLLTMRIPTLVAAAALLSASLAHAASPLIKTGETVAFLRDLAKESNLPLAGSPAK